MLGRHSYIPSDDEHVEHIGEQMRDTTELDNLKDETMRNLKGEQVVVPWRTGRPLRSAGMTDEGTPLTPLPARNLAAVVPEGVADKLAGEFNRATVLDRASQGVCDIADALLVEETQDEADARVEQAWQSAYKVVDVTTEEGCKQIQAADPDDTYQDMYGRWW